MRYIVLFPSNGERVYDGGLINLYHTVVSQLSYSAEVDVVLFAQASSRLAKVYELKYKMIKQQK